MKTLSQWLALLESRHPVEIDLGLDRIGKVAESLGIGRIADKVVVVGGTNGKGSCVRTLETLALKKGWRVGAYTSPHLIRYNERVRIDGSEVDDTRFCRVFEVIESHRHNVPLTYFEMGTLAALLIMQKSKLDLAVLEVGMGGRFDAVNIIDGDVSIITSVAIDHTHWLGVDREAIGMEKAGIARAGRPAICVDPNPPRSVVDYLNTIDSPAYFRGSRMNYSSASDGLSFSIAGSDGNTHIYDGLPVPAVPVASALAAVQCFQCLGFDWDIAELRAALSSVTLPGRYQRIRFNGQTIILDVAHNPAAAAYLAAKLTAEERPAVAVTALMADKDVAGFVDELADTFDHWFVGDLSGVKRALDSAQLGRVLSEKGLPNTVCKSIESAFEMALLQGGPEKTLVVCGSFFTISAILKHLGIADDL